MNSSQPLHKAYEQLVGKSLTPEQVAEIKFNLVKYVETLIAMDKQQKDWIRQQRNNIANDTKIGSDI
jgi:hypothetical protein